jgi:hypothetical protein
MRRALIALAFCAITLAAAPGARPAAAAPAGKRVWSSVCTRNFQKIQDREKVIMQGFPGQNGDVAAARHARTALFVACMSYDPEARSEYNDSLEEERSWQQEICRPSPALCQDFFPNATRALMAEFAIAMNTPDYSIEYGPVGGAGRSAAANAAPSRSTSTAASPASPGSTAAPSASSSSQDFTKPDKWDLEVMDKVDEVLALPDAAAASAKPKPKAPAYPPPQLIKDIQGTQCLDAALEDMHISPDPPNSDPNENSWSYDIVLRNKCQFPVVFYTEWLVGPPPPNPFTPTEGPIFVQGGYAWPRWYPKLPPAADFSPMETGPRMPILAGERLRTPHFQRLAGVQPVRLWVRSCNAYAPDGKRAMSLFKTEQPLFADGRFLCVPNSIPQIRY